VFDQTFIDELSKALAPRVVALLEPRLSAKIAPRYLDLDQAAVYLSTSIDGVRGLLRSKAFPARKIGARIYIDVRDIDKVMSDNTLWLK
jgi:hypothetical protein